MPDLGVVIPTLGASPALPRVLGRLQDQRASDGHVEVLVVADARASRLDELRRRIGAFPIAGTLVAERPGASAARNLGWRESSAPLILFLGDDILPSSGLLAAHLETHRREPRETVGVLGDVRWARELRVTPFMRWLEHGVQFDYPAIEGTEAGWGRFYTANASVKRSLLERVGGFDERRLPYLYEDLDLAYRMSKLGFRLLYDRKARGEHLHPADLDSWRNRAAQLAVAERRFVAIHPEIEPHFHHMFSAAVAAPPARGRGARLLGIVPRSTPWLGPRVWRSADLYFRQALAPAFLRAWEEAPATPDRSETNT